ncbi:type II CRISPR-associated endonuclease Cas1 [Azospirillum humicireducens]|uniref:CRISPR-associated endonuclease Cas1 n=1 Tax=Azospirillum humicireducens TaxID=1226968 RepID=A0A2R4VPJ6_9PROT|nr:type II CRISPR-associated endonuclease Cas1 [Azospirillum humicireducens]AWB06351.1 type II CRISPR-associated endonuclease Cas1 [Azospirillum humicireducens]
MASAAGVVVEVAEDGRHLSLDRGFMVVSEKGRELGRVPLDDMAVLIATAHGLTYSNNLLLALLERDCSVVLCGRNFSPAAILWPLDGHHIQAQRMRAQADITDAFKRRLWQAIARAKVRNQGAILQALGHPAGAFEELARKMRTGDPENIEAQAARRYWPLLFGPDFRRDADEPGINGLLNYGYAVLRGGTARATAAAGLHPSLGLKHSNRSNPMCLVDDLLEPFRPMVDIAVHRMVSDGLLEVDRETKRILAGLLVQDLRTDAGVTPLSTCLFRLATSLAQVLSGERQVLDLPLSPLPLEIARGPSGKEGAHATQRVSAHVDDGDV